LANFDFGAGVGVGGDVALARRFDLAARPEASNIPHNKPLQHHNKSGSDLAPIPRHQPLSK
jgi:hypothetical protein